MHAGEEISDSDYLDGEIPLVGFFTELETDFLLQHFLSNRNSFKSFTDFGRYAKPGRHMAQK